MSGVATPHEEMDVLPRNSRGCENIVLDMFIEAREHIMHCNDNSERKISRGVKGMEELVVFINRGGARLS